MEGSPPPGGERPGGLEGGGAPGKIPRLRPFGPPLGMTGISGGTIRSGWREDEGEPARGRVTARAGDTDRATVLDPDTDPATDTVTGTDMVTDTDAVTVTDTDADTDTVPPPEGRGMPSLLHSSPLHRSGGGDTATVTDMVTVTDRDTVGITVRTTGGGCRTGGRGSSHLARRGGRVSHRTANRPPDPLTVPTSPPSFVSRFTLNDQGERVGVARKRPAIAAGHVVSKQAGPAYFTLTLMVRGLLSSRLGRLRCSTPFSNRATTFSGSTLRGTWKARSKTP